MGARNSSLPPEADRETGARNSSLLVSDPNDIHVNLGGLYGYQSVVVHTAQALGSGAYGNVVKATIDGKSCAAKILHQILASEVNVARFEREIEIMRQMKHINIAQFLGAVQDSRTNKSILLMELLKESLTSFLEKSSEALTYYVQVNIGHDIALAVAHLHRNNILHRDLSSNNILIATNGRAKVTDFGMSKIAESDPFLTHRQGTQCPGTPVCMPPEALCEEPHYSDKIDTFSIGVLLLQIVTKKFPNPTKAFLERVDSQSVTKKSYLPVSEIERRKLDMEKVPASHGFLPVIKQCLRDISKERPNASQLCQSLGTLKTSEAYHDSRNLPPFEGRTELHDVAQRGDVKAVQRLSASVNINSRTREKGFTALLLASLYGHVEVVKILVSKTAMVNLQDKDGVSPVYAASQKGHTEVVDLLVKAGADIHLATTKHGSVPLGIAAQNGHTETVQRLLELGADPNHQNKAGCTPLLTASFNGHSSVVRLLLGKKAGVNICNKDGCSPVYVASQKGHTEVVDLLVQAGAGIHLATIKYGSVPLGIAAQNGHTETVQRLLELGADPNHQNKTGRTPLFAASFNGHSTVVRLLLGKKAGVNICEEDGWSPVYAASLEGHTEVVDLLVQAGADIHLASTDEYGSIPLGIAAENGHTEIVQRLLELGADPNHQNKKGHTALDAAKVKKHSEVVQLLTAAISK